MSYFFCLGLLAGSELVLFLKSFQEPLSPILQCHFLAPKAFKFYIDILGKICEFFLLNVDDGSLLKH